MTTSSRTPRQHLNADALYATLRSRFDTLTDSRTQPTCSLSDALMAGFALFALKDPSLLAFDQRRLDPDSNLHSLFGITTIPCDSQLRNILDTVDPQSLRPCFTDIFRQLQRGKALVPFAYHDDHYLLSFDGTGYFSSQKIHCPHCLQRRSPNGVVTYHHQLLTAVLVHPDFREVIPVMPEAILREDGASKNDCERNAAKRFFASFRADHPHLKVIATGDGLTSNAPLIRCLGEHNIRFILGAKPGDHQFLFAQMQTAFEQGKANTLSVWDEKSQTMQHYRWLSEVSLNGSNADVRVTLLEYWEVEKGVLKHQFSWVTDLELTAESVEKVMRGGRARWKIENETFNTLKNQGYQLEHNFGHGQQHLSVVFALLMLLAFLVDQVQQRCCPVFGAAWKKSKSKRQLWEVVRHLFHDFVWKSLLELLEAIVRGIVKGKAVLSDGS